MKMTQLKDYEIIQTNIFGLHYYKKTMETKTNTNYYAHIFFTEPMKVVDLGKHWEDITSVVAVRYQSKVENLIERSNFYIIFYVDGEIDDSLSEKIEGDEFCARKYLVKEPYMDEESAICNINAKLFSFASKGIIPGVEKPIHVNKLVLHNFRTYENRRTFDFTCSDNGPSSFVLIYAKNGVGKTSIFDGVEFLLKGVVDRINALQKINSRSVTPDTMLHNINHKNEESTVLAILSDSNELERRVGWNTDNDLRQNVPVKGKDFIYDGSNQRDWQKIILPHDSIDGYTTSNTPEIVYRDWIKQSNLREESESFLKINQDCNKIKKVISDCGLAISRLDVKLEEMRCNRDAVEEIIRLLAMFNTKKRELGFPDGNDMFLSMDADVEAYDLLINSSKSYNRLIELRIRDQIIPEKEKLSVIQKRGKGYYEKKHSEYISLNAHLEELKNKMDLRKKFEEILETLSSVSNERIKYNNEMQQLIVINNYGGVDEIWNKADRILELQLKDAGFKEIIPKLKGSLDQQVNDLMKVRASIEVLEAKVSDEGKYRDALKAAEDYEIINAMVSNLNVSLENNQSNLETLERSMKRKNEDNKVFLIHLPNKLQEVNIDMVHSCMEFLGFSKVEGLFSLVKEYDSIQAEIKVLENQIQKRS